MINFSATPNSPVTTVQNSLYYLNDFSNLITDNGVPLSLPEVAYFLASFAVIITSQKTGPALTNELQIIELTKTFNPNTRFYIYIDGRQVSTALLPTPTEQITTLINTAIDAYTVGTVTAADGIYIDYFNFPNVDNTTGAHQTFRDVQLTALSTVQINNLFFAFTCEPDNAGESTWDTVTNLPYILNRVFTNQPINTPIFFNVNCLLVTTNLFGSSFSFNPPLSTGWEIKAKFFYDVLLINSILTSPFNINMQAMMAITTIDVNSFKASGFFSKSLPPPPFIVTGAAQTALNLCYWLNYQYLATSAYPDFYLSESGAQLVNYIFAYDVPTASSFFNNRGVIIAINQDILQYSVATSGDILEIVGSDTSSLIITAPVTFANVINV